MKYIRTKDGRILDFDKLNEVSKLSIDMAEEPIREADTIEELCDEFVGVDKTCENGHQLLRAVPYKCANYWNGGVYGAIWTSKGLIYVAKMDSDGKLVLI